MVTSSTSPPARLDRVFCRAMDTASPATLSMAMMEVTCSPMVPASIRASRNQRKVWTAVWIYILMAATDLFRSRSRSTIFISVRITSQPARTRMATRSRPPRVRSWMPTVLPTVRRTSSIVSIAPSLA